MREHVQPPGSPETAATKPAFKSQGNPAAVRFSDFFLYRNLIKFGEKNHDLFSPNLIVTNEGETKSETIKAQTDAENPYKIKETSKNITNGDAKKMQTTAGNPSKMISSQRQSTNKNLPPKAQERQKQTRKKSRSPMSAIHP